MTQIKLPNSETTGLKVLIIDPNDERGLRSQVTLEDDPDLNRALIFVTSDLAEAKVWIVKQKIHLAIFPQKVGKKDFVSVQLELLKASPDIQMIPLIETPTIKQLRESKSIGHVADYGEENALSDPTIMKELIFSFVRLNATESAPIKTALDYAKPIRNALNLTNPYNADIKSKSENILKQLLFYYEVEFGDVPPLLAAEYLYLPGTNSTQYSALLNPDPQELLPILHATGSSVVSKAPTTLFGFLITIAYHIAECLVTKVAVENLISEIEKRPPFLKHTAIRTLTPEIIRALYIQASSKKEKTG